MIFLFVCIYAQLEKIYLTKWEKLFRLFRPNKVGYRLPIPVAARLLSAA